MKHLLLICLLATLLAGCGGPDAAGDAPASEQGRATPAAQPPSRPPAAGSELIAAKRRRIKPPAGATRTAALVGGLNRFALDLYHATAKREDGNLIYSPYSIALAFSMVYAGARGETEAQMADVLGFLPQKSQHPAANALERRLASLDARAPAAGTERDEAFRLRIANAVWGQRGFPFRDAYLRTLAEQYGAGLRTVDFGADPEGGRKAVNAWVSDETEGRIPDILPDGVLNPDTRLVLANAVYFKASSLYPFEKVDDGAFTLLDGSRVRVPMMRQETEPLPYVAGDGYQAVVLPYAGGTADMVIIEPKAGRFETVEARLSANFLKGVLAASGANVATLTMPRLDFESQLDLARILPDMGMPAPFDPNAADFSGIARRGQLYVSAAIHRATLTVDEEGTEATAATAIVIKETALIVGRRPHLTIDRPFIFAIVERGTGAILFLGRVTNPAR